MIYIYNPGQFRDAIVELLDSMGVDFTEDPRNALNGASKILAAKRNFDYGVLRALLSSGASHREISRRLGMPGATWWRYARLVPLEEISEEHRDFFAGYRELVGTKTAVAKLTRGLCDELAGRGVRELLGTGTQVSTGNMRRGRRSSVRSLPQGKESSGG